MHIKTTYLFENSDGIRGIACGYMPENVTVIETRPVLYAEDGFVLYKNGIKIGNAIWLKDGDTQDNYTETEDMAENNEEKDLI